MLPFQGPQTGQLSLTVFEPFRSVLDYNPINTIASHMGYWSDEDVNHFMLSQLLSNKSKPQGK